MEPSQLVRFAQAQRCLLEIKNKLGYVHVELYKNGKKIKTIGNRVSIRCFWVDKLKHGDFDSAFVRVLKGSQMIDYGIMIGDNDFEYSVGLETVYACISEFREDSLINIKLYHSNEDNEYGFVGASLNLQLKICELSRCDRMLIEFIK